MKKIAITCIQHPRIGYRQRKARALQKAAKIPDFAHRQDPWRQATQKLAFRLGQRGAQFLQAAPTGKNRQKQAIRLQGPQTLDQLANRIIGPMQSHCMNNKIMRPWHKRQGVKIGANNGLRLKIRPRFRKSCDDGRFCKPSVNLVQSFLDLGNRKIMQEKIRTATVGAGAIAGKGRAVGQ